MEGKYYSIRERRCQESKKGANTMEETLFLSTNEIIQSSKPMGAPVCISHLHTIWIVQPVQEQQPGKILKWFSWFKSFGHLTRVEKRNWVDVHTLTPGCVFAWTCDCLGVYGNFFQKQLMAKYLKICCSSSWKSVRMSPNVRIVGLVFYYCVKYFHFSVG